MDDYIIDGGILNNTPLKYYLESKINPGTQQMVQTVPIHKSKVMLDVGTQTESVDLITTVLEDTKDKGTKLEESSSEQECISPGLETKRTRFRMNFICVNTINIQDTGTPEHPGYNNIKKCKLDDVTLMDFVSAYIHKLFYHQDCYQQKYKKYMLDINYAKYTFISHTNLKITQDQMNILINDGFTAMEQYYKNKLCWVSDSDLT
jgi:hypothetical protein